MTRSTSFAAIRVAAMTIAALTMRCQKALMGALFVPVDRLPAGDAVLGAVPPGDLVFADVPAEEHDLALPLGDEVEQPDVRVLEDHPELVEAIGTRRRHLRERLQLGAGLGKVAARVAAAVAGDRGVQLRLLVIEVAHPRPDLDEPLGGRPHRLERAVSLGGSERASGHGAA